MQLRSWIRSTEGEIAASSCGDAVEPKTSASLGPMATGEPSGPACEERTNGSAPMASARIPTAARMTLRIASSNARAGFCPATRELKTAASGDYHSEAADARHATLRYLSDER